MLNEFYKITAKKMEMADVDQIFHVLVEYHLNYLFYRLQKSMQKIGWGKRSLDK